jgi:hypothetical protein
MRKLLIVLGGSLLSASLFAQQAQTQHTTLKVGDMAPDFTLGATVTPSTPRGTKIHLSDFRGKSNVVLAFFPAAFTGG